VIPDSTTPRCRRGAGGRRVGGRGGRRQASRDVGLRDARSPTQQAIDKQEARKKGKKGRDAGVEFSTDFDRRWAGVFARNPELPQAADAAYYTRKADEFAHNAGLPARRGKRVKIDLFNAEPEMPQEKHRRQVREFLGFPHEGQPAEFSLHPATQDQ
jgi:hypothetical protein